MGTAHTLHLSRSSGLILLLACGLVTGCSSSGGSPAGPSAATGTAPAPATSAPATSTPATTATSGSPAPSTRLPSSTAAGPSGGAVPASFTPTSATFVSTDTGWALGTAPCSAEPCTSIVRTRDGGRTWRGIPAPRVALGGPGGSVSAPVSVLRFADTSNGWAGVDGLYSTHDGGSSWHRQEIGPAGSSVTAIQTGGGFVFVSVGCTAQSGADCPATVRVYAAAIGGDRWREVANGLPGRVGDSGLTVHGDTWYLPTARGIYRGSGTGAAVRLPDPCPTEGGSSPTPRIAVADSNHLDAVCLSQGASESASYQLYGTTDGARSWQRAGAARRGPSDLTGIADNAHGVLLLAAAGGDSEVLRTTDDGRTFSTSVTTTAGGGREWYDLGFTSSSQAVVVLPNEAMYLSHDGGRTFVAVRF